MQKRVVLWITGAFCTSPTMGVEAITGLILINLYLKKLYQRFHLQEFSLPPNHIIKSVLTSVNSNKHDPRRLSLESLTAKQKLKLWSPLIDMDNSCNEYIPLFSPFNQEFSPRNRLIGSFSDQFSFHYHSQEAKNHIKNLDNAVTEASLDPSSSIVVLDASIKNSIATSILHIHSYNKPIVKTIHRAINITTTEVELFTIRCGINQTINIPNIKHIIIATDSIHATERIFDSSSHPYQTHSTAISMKLREFFKKDINNHIDFWDCPSKVKWPLHLSVNSDTRKFLMLPSFPCKSSWDFCKECNNESVLSSWKMSFQASDYKGRQFLELLDSDLNPLKPSTKNSSP